MQGGAGFTWIFAQMLSERKISLTALASGNKQRLIKAYRCCQVAPSTDTDTIIQPVQPEKKTKDKPAGKMCIQT